MTTLRPTALLAGLLLLLAAAPAWAQLDDDPAVARMKKALSALGQGRALSNDAGFQRARSNWRSQGQAIDKAIKEQNAAGDGTAEQLKQVKTLYASRARTRGTAVDHYLHGRMLGLTGELDRAYEQFKLALQQDLYFYWAWDGIGVYHVNRGDYALAREAFKRVLQLNPDYRKAAFGIVESYTQERNVQQAVSKLQEIISNNGRKLDPEIERQARLQLANLYRGQGEPASAIKELDWLIKNGVDIARVRAMRANCNTALERWAAAISDYRRMLELDPEDHRWHFYIARCYVALGRNADAAREYGEGLRIGGTRIDRGTAATIEEERLRLLELPPVQKPDKRSLGLDDYINLAKNSASLEKRRQAVFTLVRSPLRLPSEEATKKVLGAFLNGVRDPDPVIQAVCLREVVRRLGGTQRDDSIRALVIEVVRSGGTDPKLRGMAYRLLGTWEDRYVMPYLLMGMRGESDPYVFEQLHETMNRVSLAWVERIAPPNLTAQDMARIRSKWEKWYREHRDAYRKYEPEDFK